MAWPPPLLESYPLTFIQKDKVLGLPPVSPGGSSPRAGSPISKRPDEVTLRPTEVNEDVEAIEQMKRSLPVLQLRHWLVRTKKESSAALSTWQRPTLIVLLKCMMWHADNVDLYHKIPADATLLANARKVHQGFCRLSRKKKSSGTMFLLPTYYFFLQMML